MAICLYCRCGAIYDATKLDEDKLYKCRECGSTLSPLDAIDTEDRDQKQSSVIPKAGTFISLVLIVALALLGIAVASFQVNAKVAKAGKDYEDKVAAIKPKLDDWKQQAADIRIEDKSAEKASEYMADVFERITYARKKVYPAVVRIFCSTSDGSAGTGSGVIFMPEGHEERGPEGYIVTNFHVVQDSILLEVTLSNQESAIATRIYADDFCDVAVIKLDDAFKAKGIEPARFGDSDKIRVGDYCMTMGAPQGLGRSCAFGIIVGRGKYIPTPLGNHIAHQEHEFFQMDASINHGNSGGPLVSLKGQIIGLNTLGITMLQKTGYAVCGNYEAEIANEIIRNHENSRVPLVNRSTYGIQFLPLCTIGMQDKQGVLVGAVENDSPAYAIGLRPGDVITSAKNLKSGATFDGQKLAIRQFNDLGDAVYIFQKIEIGTSMEVTWVNPITEEQQSGTMVSTGLPAQIDPLDMASRLYFNSIFTICYNGALEEAGFNSEDSGGFQIHGWADPLDFLVGGPALDLSQFGFQRGDIIRTADGRTPRFVRELWSFVLNHYQRDLMRGQFEPMIFEVIRGKTKIFVEVNLN